MTGCADVCLDYGGGDPVEFSSARIVKARKTWRCAECQRPINPGDRYEYVFGKFEGDLFTERTCAPCHEIRKAFVCGDWVFGQLWDAIEEAIFPRWAEEGPFDCLAKLATQEARDYMQDRYDEWNYP